MVGDAGPNGKKRCGVNMGKGKRADAEGTGRHTYQPAYQPTRAYQPTVPVT